MAPPIGTLPEELVATVFDLAIDPEISGYPRSRAALALVCKNWGDIVQHTPFLWSKITHLYSLALNTRSITRSRNSPLDITFVIKTGSLDPTTEYLMESFVMACRHVHRWRTVNLSFYGPVEVRILDCLTDPAPLLEEVDIELDFGPEDWPLNETVTNLFGGHADRLKSIRLFEVSVRWSAEMFSNLEVLDLDGIRPAVPFTGILATLHASPRLTKLRLATITFDRLAPDSLEDSVIQLPHLHHLHLSELPHLEVLWLLHHIRAPSCQGFTLASSLDDASEGPSFMLLIQRFIPHIVENNPSAVSKLQVGFDYLDYSTEFLPASPYHLDISLDGISPAPLIQSLFSILPAHYLHIETTLSLNGYIPPETIRTISATADKAHIIKLSLDLGDQQSNEAILRHLAEPSWLFPALGDLFMINTTPAAIYQMVRARYGIHPLAEEGSGLPIRFSRLRMLGHRQGLDADHERLEALVGKEVLSWTRHSVAPEDPEED